MNKTIGRYAVRIAEYCGFLTHIRKDTVVKHITNKRGSSLTKNYGGGDFRAFTMAPNNDCNGPYILRRAK